MKKIIFIALIILILMAANLYAAGSAVTQSGTGYGFAEIEGARGPTGVFTLTLLLTSDDATGAVTAAISTANMAEIVGRWITLVECFPDGTDTPSNLYDLTLTTTTGGLDIMGGALANRTSATTGDQALPLIGTVSGPRPINGNLTINGSNMGNSKKVTVIITLSR